MSTYQMHNKRTPLMKQIRQSKASYLMIAPYFILFFIFTVLPVIMAVVVSFTDWNMLQMPNLVKNPKCWIPPVLASAITGPLATCLFRLEMNGAPVSSGMGTCGLVGQIGVFTGWLNDIGAGTKSAITFMDWFGLVMICFLLPGLLSWLFCRVLRKIGWIKENDLKLEL